MKTSKFLKLKLNIITPIVMQGNNKVVEIRPNSMRGVFRWWLRACIAREKRNEIEEEIFGSTQKASSVRILPINFSHLDIIDVNDENPSWNHPLFYFNYNIKNRKAFPENKNFRINIIINNLDNNHLKLFFNSIYLLSYLGGIGARSRRGYGSVMIDLINEDNDYSEYNYSKINKLEDYLENLKKLIKSCNNTDNIFDYYHLSNIQVYIDKGKNNGFNNYIDALKEVKNKMQKIRGRKDLSGYSDSIKPLLINFVNRNTLSAPFVKIESFGFGLPLNYQSRSLRTKFNNNAKSIGVTFSAQKIERLASPIIIKIIRIKNKYYPVISYFKNNILTTNISIKGKFDARFKNRNNDFSDILYSKLNISMNDNIPQFIEEFLNQFEKII